MKIQERYLWIATALLIAFMMHNQLSNNDNLRALITTYDLEANIQNAQLIDFAQQMDVAKQASYGEGFEAGRTQAAVILMDGGSLYNYTEGYHAAVGQFGIADPDGQGLSQDFLLELLLDTLDNEIETETTYLDIIEVMLSNKDEELKID
jgi:hypothetical protein